jgi:hypothetical protein
LNMARFGTLILKDLRECIQGALILLQTVLIG